MIFENVSLADKHTFHINVSARKLSYINSVDDYVKLKEEGFFSEKHLILGSGSNVLFTKDYDGWVAVNRIKGMDILSMKDVWVHIRIGSGENWHGMVKWAVENNFGGIENLALIPGTVGAAPIQNIGAYGTEISDVLETVEGYDENGRRMILKKSECSFGYRDSIFKRELKNRFFITFVTLRLTLNHHNINYSYFSLKEYMERKKITFPTLRDIFDAVMDIRKSKLPDPDVTGNAGSFFKNPSLSVDEYEAFRKKFPDVPSYPSGERTKIPAAWLIEKAGFKGTIWKGAAVHPRQPLVIVNHENASGSDVWELCLQIQEKVAEMFGINLEPEVNIIH